MVDEVPMEDVALGLVGFGTHNSTGYMRKKWQGEFINGVGQHVLHQNENSISLLLDGLIGF